MAVTRSRSSLWGARPAGEAWNNGPVPKITAATVAEHRAMKERQVIEAAAELLTTEGPSSVSPAAVAQRTGLARTSVYQYARSGPALVALAVEELFVRANAALVAAVEAAGPDPVDRLEAIIRTVLEGASDTHAPDQALDIARLPAEQRDRLAQLHGEIVAPLAQAIAATGAQDVASLTALSWGAINGVVPLISRGMPVDRAVQLAVTYVRAGVDATLGD